MLNNVNPRFAALEIVHNICSDAVAFCNDTLAFTSPQSDFDVSRYGFGNGGAWVAASDVALRLNDLEGVGDIRAACHDFKVVDSVVCLDAIDVIDGVSGRDRSDKVLGDKPVNLFSSSDAVDYECEAQIAVCILVQGPYLSRLRCATFPGSHDAPEVRHGVERFKANDWLPSFNGHVTL
jgi:hypothetical protein